jgi:prepilin-type N-terminal cleavage/methylation domain-containing protein/prepilin-type processing-associated H-X9-DG protein
MRRQCRAAFTLIEVLVVIGIIVLLIGLAIPAIQRVRATLDRIACGQKMRQLGFALHAYHLDRTILPPGCSYENGNSPEPHLSWLARLLPYLDQTQLWQETQQAFAQEKFFLKVPPHSPLGVQPAAFVCPSDPRMRQQHIRPNVLGGTVKIGYSSYLGVSGINQNTRDGVLHLDSRVHLGDITDGLSQTVFVGERPPSALLNAGWWYAGWGMQKNGAGEMIMGVLELNTYDPNYPFGQNCGPGPFEFSPGKLNRQADMFHFWSVHPSGANFLFGDNSVRFMSYSAKSILPALATYKGKEAPVGLD